MTSDKPLPVVRAERESLCDTFLAVGPDAPTLCDPWRTRDLAAHLVVRERRPDLAPGLVVPALADRLEKGQAEVAAGDWEGLVATVRSGPPWWSPTRLGPVDAVVNTVELVVHHEDVLRGDGAVGPRRTLPLATERAVLGSLRTSARLMLRGSPVGVRLVAPGFASGPVTAGQDARVVTVTGAPLELLLVASGRLRVAQVELEGAPADVESLRSASLGV